MLKRFALPVAAAVAMTGFLVPQAVAEEPALDRAGDRKWHAEVGCKSVLPSVYF
ncbi:hypothetical protein FRC0119_00621 [Corynebacterium diphtheriae]|nr:hypothetical protein FRC0119_00621 [Corynebacterium diphtheriae]